MSESDDIQLTAAGRAIRIVLSLDHIYLDAYPDRTEDESTDRLCMHILRDQLVSGDSLKRHFETEYNRCEGLDEFNILFRPIVGVYRNATAAVFATLVVCAYAAEAAWYWGKGSFNTAWSKALDSQEWAGVAHCIYQDQKILERKLQAFDSGNPEESNLVFSRLALKRHGRRWPAVSFAKAAAQYYPWGSKDIHRIRRSKAAAAKELAPLIGKLLVLLGYKAVEADNTTTIEKEWLDSDDLLAPVDRSVHARLTLIRDFVLPVWNKRAERPTQQISDSKLREELDLAIRGMVKVLMIDDIAARVTLDRLLTEAL